MATAQINARIDAACKSDGDTGLAAAGLSPSQAVRALWELAAQNVENPEAITDALFPNRRKQQDATARSERNAKAKLIAQGPRFAEEFYTANGIEVAPTAAPSFDELKEAAAMERYGKEMGWGAHE